MEKSKNNPGGIKVIGKKVYRGPHLASRTPMICMTVDLGLLENYPTDKIAGFTGKLLNVLPGLQDHGCSYGEPGGFVRRMQEGTWLGHVIEHVALELQFQAGIKVSRGKTRSVKGKPGVYNIMFAYETDELGLMAGRFALEIVNSILPEKLYGLTGLDCLGVEDVEFTTADAAIQYLNQLAGRQRLGPTTRSIVEAANKRGIPAMRLDNQSMVQLGWGRFQRRIRASITDQTSHIAVENACDKEITKDLLAAANIPVPKGSVVRNVEDALEAASHIGFPVTVKPLDGNHGRGVTTNIRTAEQLRNGFALALEHGRNVVVEQHYHGKDYRVLVINGRVAAVAERVPAHVVGDGVHTIQELIDIVNADPRRGNGHENILSKIVLNEHDVEMLHKAGASLTAIPYAGEVVWLRCTANLSTGGTAIDRTDVIHPENTALMERAARAIGLDIAGIDLIMADISQPIRLNGGGIVEINAAPGFRMHTHPTIGKSRPVGDAVVSMLFPEGTKSRVPVIAITGTNGKSTTTRMVAHILRQGGHSVGFTSTSGVYINDDLIWEGDASGPQSARMILRNPGIDYAVLETARGGILREGLGFDACDVGAVLNVTEDHLGIGGINTVEDLAAVKAVIVENVSKTGVSVLNADDPLTMRMTDIARGQICYFSMYGGHKMSAELRHHIEKGGMAIVRESWIGHEEIVVHKDSQRLPLIQVSKIPAAFGGAADFNVQNALAATAVAVGLGIDFKTISNALTIFATSYEENPGRFNIYDGHGFRVIMDYAHNPAALNALIKVVENMRDGYGSVIGNISIPGDRRDDDIREMGRLAASCFDYLVFREGPDLRGREPGSVTKLLSEGAQSAGFPAEDILCVTPEEEAHDACLRKAGPGDLVVLTPSDVQGTWQGILNFKPNPLPGFTNPLAGRAHHA